MVTASAGVAPKQFLAKIASDWRKPNGLFVIQPDSVNGFLSPLPVSRLPGVGRVTETRLEELGIQTVEHLRGLESAALEGYFGRFGKRLYAWARGTVKASPTGRPNRYPPKTRSSAAASIVQLPARSTALKNWNATAKFQQEPCCTRQKVFAGDDLNLPERES